MRSLDFGETRPNNRSVRLAYRSWDAYSAAAPVALLLHGATGSAETWWRVGPALAAAGWSVVAFDLRGHGASPRADGPYTIVELAADIDDTIDGLGFGPLDVVWGHSVGALVALSLVATEKPLARRVILEEPPGRMEDEWVAYAPQIRAERARVLEGATEHVRRVITEQPRWDDADAACAALGILSCDAESLAQSSERGLQYDTLAMLRRLRVPALLMLGSPGHSALFGAERPDCIATLPPGSVIEFDSGHVVHRDQFDESIARVVAWLGTAGENSPSAKASGRSNVV